MAFKLGPLNFNAVAQGVSGLVFGSNDQSAQDDDGGVEQLLERISNGVLAEDRHQAMSELQDVVAESRSAQLSFGAMGLPVILSILKEERNDLDLVRGALETLVNALATTEYIPGNKSQVQPGVINSELLSREPGSVALILSLLEEQDFHVRYYTLRLLTTLATNCSVRLQEAMLSTPQGITHLMDLMQDREVIRNEALLLLAYLTRAAEEIQKIAVFEGVFEKIFSIITEEGGSEGGIVVQDCLELLNNILWNNSSNQNSLRETVGFQPILSFLKIRKSNALNLTQQKTVNLLCILETVNLLLTRAPDKEPGKDATVLANQTVLAQNNLLDHLLAFLMEGRMSAAAVRGAALRCIGDLIHGHARNRDLLGSKTLGEEPDAEPALSCILRILLNTSNLSECIAAEYVIKCFCEWNPDGQIVLASTITPVPESSLSDNKAFENDRHISFGSMLLHALHSRNGQKDLEASCRAVSVLTHVLKDNIQCKELVLHIPLEIPSSALVPPDLLMSRCMRYLAAAAQSQMEKLANRVQNAQLGKIWLQPILLRLLVTWLADCPAAVASLLEIPAHLAYIVELLESGGSPASVHVGGLAAVLLGECIIYTKGAEHTKSGSLVLDTIIQKVGLSAYFAKWEALQGSEIFLSATSPSRLPKPLTRSTAAAVVSGDGFTGGFPDPSNGMSDHDDSEILEPVVTNFYDSEFVKLIRSLEPLVREKIIELYSHPTSKETVLPQVLDRSEGESEADYVGRLQSSLQKQTQAMQEILARNAALTEELLRTRGTEGVSNEKGIESDEGNNFTFLRDQKEALALRTELETLRQKVQEYQQKIRTMENKLSQAELEVAKHEVDLKNLSDAYNSLEQDNYRLDMEVRSLRSTKQGKTTEFSVAELQVAREEGRQEALKENETELNDLLVCLGQEESKVEKMRNRLEELGEDVDALLEGIGEAEGEDESLDEKEED